METLLIQLTVTSQHEDRQYAPDLETILAMPLLDKGKGTLVTKRLKAGWSIDYLFSLLEICSVCPDYSIKKSCHVGEKSYFCKLKRIKKINYVGSSIPFRNVSRECTLDALLAAVT